LFTTLPHNKLLRSTLIFVLSCFSGFVNGQTAWPEELILVPEKSEFINTSSYHDVIRFLTHLKDKSPFVHLSSMGNSSEGKEIPVVILANPAVKNAKEAKASGKPVIYVQGNIHAGEVEGKEALMMLMREILLGDKSYLLQNQILLFAPIYNTDSNDKMAEGRRPSQEDSPREVGLRENSQGLDLNRDGVKMEAPETQGLFSRIITDWDPQLFVDLHTTNGTWHAYNLTWSPSYHSAGEASTYAYTKNVLLKFVSETLKDKYDLFTGPYGDFQMDEGWPLKNFYTYNHHPRYLVNQFGFRNRMAILSEAFSHERFYQRINSTYYFTLEILNYTNSHAIEIQSVNKQAEDAAVKNVLANAGKKKKGVRFKMVSTEELDDFKTYDYVSSKKSDGSIEWIRTGKIVSYDNVQYHATFQATTEATLPRGYIIPAEFSAVVDLLIKQGITVTSLERAQNFSGELFLIERLVKAPKVFEGHNMATLNGHFIKSQQKFKKGDFVVDLAQPLSNLIFYLLEPQSDDGLATWNFFDFYLEKQGVNNKPVQYPVFKYYIN
jgi:hypothetical protein